MPGLGLGLVGLVVSDTDRDSVKPIAVVGRHESCVPLLVSVHYTSTTKHSVLFAQSVGPILHMHLKTASSRFWRLTVFKKKLVLVLDTVIALHMNGPSALCCWGELV